MKVEELKNFGIDEFYVEKFKEFGIEKLYPPQEQAVKKGLLEGKNLVLSVPTAAGKTLIAILATIKKLSRHRCKIVYIVPLVALANEKFNLFKSIFQERFKVAISVGDFDETDPWLKTQDIIVVTSEKLDSLIRHGVEWVEEIELIIADEIHLLQDPSRGPTFEILLTRLRSIVPKAQFLALSASIKNAEEIANWLDAKLIKSDFRPVKLYEGVCFDYKINFLDKKGYELSRGLTLEEAIVENTLKQNWQVFFLVSTRRKAESLAEKLCGIVKNFLNGNEEKELEKISEEVLNVLEFPTNQCKKLSKCIKNGVAFHHAGLLGSQKRMIEENFKKRIIKVICCTPTLAMGVSFPADRVIIKDVKRYYPGVGAVYIPVLDYYQMKGRAGRPEWSPFGEAILIARSEEEAQELYDHFIMGEPEEIQSKLAAEPSLRMHTLALIASEFCKSEKSLLEFFSKTFFAFQYGNVSFIEEKILEILEMLEKWKFIERKKEKLFATKIGKRVSELYIDPLTANYFIECLNRAIKKETQPFSFLQVVSKTTEMRPLLNIRTGEFSELNEKIAERENLFLQEIPKEWDLEFDDFLRSVKTALMFETWINEASEEEILTKFRVAPGEFYVRREIVDWLVYSLQELSLLLNYKKLLLPIRKLRVRLEYGVKEELLPFVRLKGIGRMRARKLFNSGIKTVSDLKKIPLGSLVKLVGEKTAYKIKEQLEVKKKEEQTTL
ncbi:MAG: DEAD/DEAH box helicase [Candidatus Aenigmatarchaeota archaeon]